METEESLIVGRTVDDRGVSVALVTLIVSSTAGTTVTTTSKAVSDSGMEGKQGDEIITVVITQAAKVGSVQESAVRRRVSVNDFTCCVSTHTRKSRHYF